MRTTLGRARVVLLMILLSACGPAEAQKLWKLNATHHDGSPAPGINLWVLASGNKFGAGTTDSQGRKSVSLDLGHVPAGQQMQAVVRKCRRESDGREMATDTFLLGPGQQAPPMTEEQEKKCSDYPAGAVLFGDDVNLNVDAPAVLGPGVPAQPPPSSSQTSMGTTGAGIQFQLRGFGGASLVNGNTPATAGFDGGVFFPLGNRISIGPTAGFQWINSSIVNSIGSQQPGSTFIHTGAGFKQGNFGGSVGFPFGGFQLGIQGGATVANSTITQQFGFCGLGNATSPAGCTVFSSTTTHDTLVSPFVGGYISHSIFSHLGVFAGYNYHFGLKDTKPNATNPTGPPVTILNLHYSDAVAGLYFTFGRHKK
jgi:hypothetical protein